MPLRRPRGAVHLIYLATLSVKGLDGLIETVLGILVAFTGPQKLSSAILRFIAPDLSEHPDNHVLSAVHQGVAHLAHAPGGFTVFYLLVHGVLKTAIAANLLLDEEWAYLPSIVILSGFILYMGFRLTHVWSPWLFGFLIFDLVTLALVLNEYLRGRPRAKQRA
jgi:uncharacterized membrane protein